MMNEGMVHVRLATDSDQNNWDHYISGHPWASPYHSFAWKRAIEASYGHKGFYLLAEINNTIVGVLPVVQLRLQPFLNEIVGLPFCDLGSCLASNDRIQDLLLIEAIKYREKLTCARLQIRGPLTETELVRSRFSVIETGKVRMCLELPPSSGQLFEQFKSKLRSQVRKAEKNGVKFLWARGADLGKAYGVFAKNMHELGSPVHARHFLKNVLVYYGENARLGLTEWQNEIIGMGIILIGNEGVFIPWASTLREYNRLNPNMLLYWNFLKYAADSGCRYFDFGRSSEGEGTYKFKRQWGALQKPLDWFENIDSGRKDKKKYSNSGRREKVAAFWQKMPLGMANRIGPHLRKYINL